MLLEAQVTAFVGAFLLLVAFLLAHQRFPSDFSWYWLAGWAFYVTRFLLDILETIGGPNRLVAFGTNMAVATSAVLILLAVIHLVEPAESYDRPVLGLWVVLVGWNAVAILLDFGFVATYTPLYVTFGAIQLVTAYLFYQYLTEYAYSSGPLIVGSLIIWGLHKFNYPVLRPIESLAPYGYILGAILAFSTGLGVMMFLLEDAERQAKEEKAVANRRSEEYEDLFDNIPDPVYIHDLEGNFLKVNDTAVDVIGYSRAELHSMTPRDIVAPAYQDNIKERIKMAWSEASITFDSKHITAEGRAIDVSVNAAKIRYQGRPAVLAVVRDVSERKALEQRLSVVNRILRHDIRSAVNIIKGNAEIARRGTEGADEPLETVIEESDRLSDLGEKAQKIERMMPGTESRTEELDVSLLVESKLLKLRNDYPHVEFSKDIPEDVYARVGARFDEAIENLLVNAIVHNDEDPAIHVEVREADESVSIRIADNGPGIPEDEIRPLEEGEETALHHTSGLGLWFVHWLVEQSDGQLEFEANEPTGTIVTLTVPKSRSESDAATD
ncbi:MAG: PAS domain S-box protein [Halodesulfurarchaeum sp.]